MREQIDAMMGQAEFGTVGEHQEVLETYKMFAYDEGWSRRINEAIDSGLTAEAAIERVRQRTAQRMRQIDDPLLQDRMHDLDDLANRLLRIVSGQLGTAAQAGLPQDAVLIARNLGPAELLEYDRRKLKGVILEEGSLTAHVTIVARAMGVPMIGRVAQRPPADRRGRPRPARRRRGASPSPGRRRRCEEAFDARARRRARSAAPNIAALTRPAAGHQGRHPDHADGQCRPARRRRRARARPAPTASACSAPNSSSWSRRPCRGARASSGSTARCSMRPATSRSSSAPSTSAATRACPISTRRAPRRRRIRRWAGGRCASRSTATTLMKAQARALLEAAAGRELQIMFPMVSEPWEFDAAKAIVEEQRAWLAERKKPLPKRIRYGAMLEVPSLAEMLDVLLPQARFPVGRHQRSHPIPVRRRSLQSRARRALRLAVAGDPALPEADRARRATSSGVPLGVCGEMGGRTLEAMALIGIGIGRLSITPVAVGPVKAMIRSLDAGGLHAAHGGGCSAKPRRQIPRRAGALGGGARGVDRMSRSRDRSRRPDMLVSAPA